jgi:hypothetical protein
MRTKIKKMCCLLFGLIFEISAGYLLADFLSGNFTSGIISALLLMLGYILIISSLVGD